MPVAQSDPSASTTHTSAATANLNAVCTSRGRRIYSASSQPLPCGHITQTLAAVEQERPRPRLCHVAFVVKRKLDPIWSAALAGGHKFVETQRYSGIARTQLAFAKPVHLIVFGPTGSNILHGIAEVGATPSLACATDAAQPLKRMMHSSLHEKFNKYIAQAACFDYVHICRVFDTRTHELSWEDLGFLMASAVPKQCQGFPTIGGVDQKQVLLEYCELYTVPVHRFTHFA